MLKKSVRGGVKFRKLVWGIQNSIQRWTKYDSHENMQAAGIKVLNVEYKGHRAYSSHTLNHYILNEIIIVDFR